MAHPGGRPTTYKEEYAEAAQILCEEAGLTDKQLCRIFGCVESTLNLWKIEHPKFSESLTKGKDAYNVRTAEACLQKRIKGYRYIETTREPGLVQKGMKDEVDPKTGEVRQVPNMVPDMVVTKKVSKAFPPDPKSIQYFLNNRSPRDPETGEKRWSNVQRLNIGGPEGGPLEFQQVKDRKDLRELGDKLLNGISPNGKPGSHAQ